MPRNIAKLIEAWFLEHDGDGEFLAGRRACPYSLIGSVGAAARIIYTTKPSIVCAAMAPAPPPSIGIVGRYGLPSKADLIWIRKLIARQQLLFLGDMDPVDLLVFAWLRASLHPTRIGYLGINDAFLGSLRLSSTRSIYGRCAPSEVESRVLLRQVFPDLRETLGRRNAELLERGHKVELDVIVSTRRSVAGALASLPCQIYPSRTEEKW